MSCDIIDFTRNPSRLKSLGPKAMLCLKQMGIPFDTEPKLILEKITQNFLDADPLAGTSSKIKYPSEHHRLQAEARAANLMIILEIISDQEAVALVGPVDRFLQANVPPPKSVKFPSTPQQHEELIRLCQQLNITLNHDELPHMDFHHIQFLIDEFRAKV